VCIGFRTARSSSVRTPSRQLRRHSFSTYGLRVRYIPYIRYIPYVKNSNIRVRTSLVTIIILLIWVKKVTFFSFFFTNPFLLACCLLLARCWLTFVAPHWLAVVCSYQQSLAKLKTRFTISVWESASRKQPRNSILEVVASLEFKSYLQQTMSQMTDTPEHPVVGHFKSIVKSSLEDSLPVRE